uniref:Uncharacterized protein n=1 Tax=Rhinolophus ferrumequinum TaxID=59479 RepID=A0A671E8J2_RHIFE
MRKRKTRRVSKTGLIQAGSCLPSTQCGPLLRGLPGPPGLPVLCAQIHSKLLQAQLRTTDVTSASRPASSCYGLGLSHLESFKKQE